jgi:monoamine oxidase
MTAHRDTEVAVIGAGYAGLTAAAAIADAGHDVLVLEARQRVGGRVWTMDAGGVPLDMGGMWVGAGHLRFRALLDRFAIPTYPTPASGSAAWWDERAARLRHARPLPMPPWAIPFVLPAMARIEHMRRRTPADQPWRAPAAERWDSLTVAQWLRRWIPLRRPRQVVESTLVLSTCEELSRVSMLTLMAFVADNGGLMRGAGGAEEGADQDLVVGGADGAARGLAHLLGDRVCLGAAVREIRHGDSGVALTGDGVRVRARRVVVALPPPRVAAIRWAPALPAWRRSLVERVPMGSVTKLMAVYDRPFWRDAGWSGEVHDATGPVSSLFDASPPGGPAVLGSLTCGARSRELSALPPGQRRRRIIDAMVRWLGPEAATPLHVADVSWEDEEFSGGGYAGVPAPGTLIPSVRLAAPIGRVHFAGTETATRSNGYIDGAIASGERAAEEVLAHLN